MNTQCIYIFTSQILISVYNRPLHFYCIRVSTLFYYCNKKFVNNNDTGKKCIIPKGVQKCTDVISVYHSVALNKSDTISAFRLCIGELYYFHQATGGRESNKIPSTRRQSPKKKRKKKKCNHLEYIYTSPLECNAKKLTGV